MKIKVINGANLNLLQKRDENHYGPISLEEIQTTLLSDFPTIKFDFFQSNIEGEIVTEIQSCIEKFDGLIINPGGYAHTSVAIKDALELFKGIKIEVHLSHLAKREEFRQHLLTASSCDGYISGFKHLGYIAAVYLILKMSEQV
jgi:3-dehydroquinate dehydratase II